MENKEFIVQQDLLQAILNYLASKPFIEVHKLIEAVSKVAPKIEAVKKEEPKQESKEK